MYFGIFVVLLPKLIGSGAKKRGTKYTVMPKFFSMSVCHRINPNVSHKIKYFMLPITFFFIGVSRSMKYFNSVRP